VKKKGKKKSAASNSRSSAPTDSAAKKRAGKKDGKNAENSVNAGNDDADSKKKTKKTKSGKKNQDQPAKDTSVGLLLPVPQEVLDMPVDPNEPTYCICQQVSYGEMIGCDNPDCPIEWFHFGCINLTAKPKGKWYCSKCTPLFKKKK
jgi:hypothetical protein